MQESEKRLLAELNRGSQSAFHTIFVAYYPALCEYASFFVPDSDAEDLVQEFMVRLWENRAMLLVDASLKAYLFAGVRNRCLNAIRNRRCKRTIQTFLYERMQGLFDDPSDLFLADTTERIARAIDELPDNTRRIFEMSRFQDLPNREIADRLHVSVKTVEYHISQALKILRVKLKDYLCTILWL